MRRIVLGVLAGAICGAASAVPLEIDTKDSLATAGDFVHTELTPAGQNIASNLYSLLSEPDSPNRRAACAALEQRVGREPTLSEIARETGLEIEEIVLAQTVTGPAESLQRESGEDGFSLELVLGDYGAEERLVEHVALRAAIERLPPREREVIALRFYHGLTQQRCANVMQVSQVQISRLERRALDRLRENLKEC